MWNGIAAAAKNTNRWDDSVHRRGCTAVLESRKMSAFARLDRLTLRLLLSQAADVGTFVWFYLFVGSTIHAERNPIILALMALGGLAAVGVFKLGVTMVVIYRYRRMDQIHHRWYVPMRTIAISAATASGIVGAGFNLSAIIGAHWIA
jgi:hypothetical protein